MHKTKRKIIETNSSNPQGDFCSLCLKLLFLTRCLFTGLCVCVKCKKTEIGLVGSASPESVCDDCVPTWTGQGAESLSRSCQTATVAESTAWILSGVVVGPSCYFLLTNFCICFFVGVGVHRCFGWFCLWVWYILRVVFLFVVVCIYCVFCGLYIIVFSFCGLQSFFCFVCIWHMWILFVWVESQLFFSSFLWLCQVWCSILCSFNTVLLH